MPHIQIPAENFQDPRWQQKRLEIMQRDNWSCCGEGEHEGMLNVHHRKYTTSEPWNEPNENLITLCERHHKAEHDGLGAAADGVTMALKKSNWMVKHRQRLQQCVEDSIITPEEFCQLVDERIKKRGSQLSIPTSASSPERPTEAKDHRVLTVPAGKALAHLTEHNVYSCPTDHPEHASDVLIFAPRESDGTMRSIYFIKSRGIADPYNLVFHPENKPEVVDAIRGYVCAVKHIDGILDAGKSYRFYYLTDFRDGTLPHGPKLDQPGPVHGYVSLRELLSGVPVVRLLERCV